MRKAGLYVLGVVCAALSWQHAYAWGREGHQMVAEIAMHYLSAAAKENVQHILGKTSPADAGTWMDDMRSTPYYEFMNHWHYVDIPKGETYKPGQGDNLIAALNTAFNDLKGGKLNREKRKEDVMILFHLIGDMHQPLHDGYPDDKGGNTVQVNYGGGGTNLHHIWDDDIIESQKITLDSCLTLGTKLSPDDIKSICAGNFLAWMNDSRSHLAEVYDFTGHKLSEAYMQKNAPLVERQLLIAGIRLAKVLEVLFGKGIPTAATETGSGAQAIEGKQ